ncbi:MAG: winged helix-turn-helix transcriptional regulator [Lachnospiraceae bacterium]|nr:winged helix-turn-helix transcriptional regulator [Lachnospiraceae bacterium]
MNWEAWYKSLSTGQKANHLFHVIEHCRKRIFDSNMAKADTSAVQQRILAILSHHEGAMSQKEIARIMGVTTSTMATTLKKMESEGLATRTMDKQDNRINNICITDKGRSSMEYGFSIMDAIDSDIVKDFTEEELASLVTLLEKYQEQLDRVKDVDYVKKVEKKED